MDGKQENHEKGSQHKGGASWLLIQLYSLISLLLFHDDHGLYNWLKEWGALCVALLLYTEPTCGIEGGIETRHVSEFLKVEITISAIVAGPDNLDNWVLNFYREFFFSLLK